MRTEHLEYLVETAHCGSMRQAAKNLFCSQPAISHAIEQLEAELGFQLLERSETGVVPTGKAGMVIDDAEQILDMIHKWTELHQFTDNQSVSGEIRAADSGEFGLTFFQDVAMHINERYPKIIMHLVTPGDILQRINLGEFDIAVLPVIPKHSAAIEKYVNHYHWKLDTLYDDDYQILINPEHPLARKSYITLADLQGENISVHNSFPYEKLLSPISTESKINIKSSIHVISDVADGHAIGIFPPSRDVLLQQFVDTGLIQKLSTYDLHMPMRYCLLYWERLPYMDAGNIVIQEMKKQYSK